MNVFNTIAYVKDGTVIAVTAWLYNELSQAPADAVEKYGEGTETVDVTNIAVKVGDHFNGEIFTRFIDGHETDVDVFEPIMVTLERHDEAIDDLAVAILEG